MASAEHTGGLTGNGDSAVLPDVPSELKQHYKAVIRGLSWGIVTPVLGAGASVFGRSETGEWSGAPTAEELASLLSETFDAEISTSDLMAVAQWIYALGGGAGQLYQALHQIFDREFPTTPLHDFIASIPKDLRERDIGKPLLIVTTNYDDLMERALQAQDPPEEFDLVYYMAEGPNRAHFFHRKPNSELVQITDPENYLDVDPDERTVVLKLHGFVCHENQSLDSYVITEDHYIEYLTKTDLKQMLPRALVTRLLNCHLLFLGYSLRDWNLRAILYRLWIERLNTNAWWGVQLKPSELERVSWENRSVHLFDIALETYLAGLQSSFSDWIKKKQVTAPTPAPDPAAVPAAHTT